MVVQLYLWPPTRGLGLDAVRLALLRIPPLRTSELQQQQQQREIASRPMPRTRPSKESTRYCAALALPAHIIVMRFCWKRSCRALRHKPISSSLIISTITKSKKESRRVPCIMPVLTFLEATRNIDSFYNSTGAIHSGHKGKQKKSGARENGSAVL